jgi:hypothetical protein
VIKNALSYSPHSSIHLHDVVLNYVQGNITIGKVRHADLENLTLLFSEKAVLNRRAFSDTQPLRTVLILPLTLKPDETCTGNNTGAQGSVVA